MTPAASSPSSAFAGCLDAALLMQWLQSMGVSAHLLELAKQDIRPDLVAIRNKGVRRFIVDVGSELIVPFFEQVPSAAESNPEDFAKMPFFLLSKAMRAGIVHRGTDFVLSDLDFWSTSVEEFAHTGSGMYGFSIIDRSAIEERVKSGEISNVSCATAHAPLGACLTRVAEGRKEGRKP